MAKTVEITQKLISGSRGIRKRGEESSVDKTATRPAFAGSRQSLSVISSLQEHHPQSCLVKYQLLHSRVSRRTIHVFVTRRDVCAIEAVQICMRNLCYHVPVWDGLRHSIDGTHASGLGFRVLHDL